MKKIIVSAALCALAAPALAQSESHNWGGAYIGLAATYVDGKNRYDMDGEYKLDGRTRPSAFVGFNQQHGRFIIGLEAGSTVGKVSEDGYSDYRYKHIHDVRVRLGHTYDRLMVYVAGGYSRARFETPADRVTKNGFNLGLGVEYALTEDLILGLDYTHRRFKRDGVDVEGGPDHLKSRVDSASLRLSYLF